MAENTFLSNAQRKAPADTGEGFSDHIPQGLKAEADLI